MFFGVGWVFRFSFLFAVLAYPAFSEPSTNTLRRSFQRATSFLERFSQRTFEQLPALEILSESRARSAVHYEPEKNRISVDIEQLPDALSQVGIPVYFLSMFGNSAYEVLLVRELALALAEEQAQIFSKESKNPGGSWIYQALREGFAQLLQERHYQSIFDSHMVVRQLPSDVWSNLAVDQGFIQVLGLYRRGGIEAVWQTMQSPPSTIDEFADLIPESPLFILLPQSKGRPSNCFSSIWNSGRKEATSRRRP